MTVAGGTAVYYVEGRFKNVGILRYDCPLLADLNAHNKKTLHIPGRAVVGGHYRMSLVKRLKFTWLSRQCLGQIRYSD